MLDASLNNEAAWNDFLRENRRRVEVDLAEVERVIDLARRTPGLSAYDEGLQQLSIFFQVATQWYRDNAPDDLPDLVQFWERYRAAVIQRFTGITTVELRAADKVVADVFTRFLQAVPNERIAYSKDATPLVYGGEGGLGAYFTHPPGLNRPFAIINLPHAAFDNVWQWLALPHETGHDIYATVEGLQTEVEEALAQRMQQAVADGEVEIPAVDVPLNTPWGAYTVQYEPEELLATIWRSWANECQADIIGVLSCGGAALAALQQIIGFEALDQWQIRPGADGAITDAPEEHPTSYVRNAFNISALRLIGQIAMADQLEARFAALRPEADSIVWFAAPSLPLVEIPTDAMIQSAEIAADVLVNQAFVSLGNQSYGDVAGFADEDQALVEAMVPRLVGGDPTFAQEPGSTARHALAATILALESDRNAGDVINRTFRHFV